MNRVNFSFLMALAAVSTSALAQAPARSFAIADVAISASKVIDARAVPGLDGAVSLLISVEPDIASSLAKASAKEGGKPINVTLNGKPIGVVAALPPAAEPIEVPVKLALSEAEGIAIHISGKPPLPDSLEEEGE